MSSDRPHRIEYRQLADLRPYSKNARHHSKAQIKQVAASIRKFGFNAPILISDDDEIIAGHARAAAATEAGLQEVPTLRLSHLDAVARKAYAIADNKLALNATWDQELLAGELQSLVDIGFDAASMGFSLAEIELTLDGAREADPLASSGPEDQVPTIAGPAVSMLGDAWQLGRHRLMCGDARKSGHYRQLMRLDCADLVFTDPPYNVPIEGHVSGLGRVRHRDFAMGVGEMSEEAFTTFLTDALGAAASRCRNGAIAFVCMDWRHMGELLAAGRQVFSELKNVCVWNKTNGGMGTFYRSKYELVFVFKVGTAPHTNTFGLGESGRYRTNVWDYPGISSLGGERSEALEMHPTVKPTALVADAIRDCSRRGQIVLDPFAGSGTTLIAAETCGRIARVMEYDPLYCDTIIRRYERLTGKSAILTRCGKDFDSVSIERTGGENER